MALKDLAEKRGEFYYINPQVIKVDPNYNVRHDTPELRQANVELRESIAANGVKTALTVRFQDNEVYVVAGHRRLAATLELIKQGIEILTVKCIPEDRNATAEDRDLDLLLSNSGHPLSMLDKATIFKRLQGYGWELEKIATRNGITVKQVRNILELGAAPTAIKEMVAEGSISPTLAVQTMRSEGEKATEVITNAVSDAKVRGKEKVTASTIKPAAAAVAGSPAKGQSYLDALLSNAPGAPTPSPTETSNQERHGFTRPRMSSERFHEFFDILAEITTLDDVAIIHTMVRDALNGSQSK